MNEILGICIPTYNRANKLEENIKHLIKECKPLAIPIYISDNSSLDNTFDVVKKYQMQYEHIYYNRNANNLGFAGNFERVLLMAETKYCWLLGDDDLIMDGAIAEISKNILCSDSYDLLVVNGGGYDIKNNEKSPRVKNLKSNIYKDKNKLIVDLAEPMSWISSLIFNRRNIEKLNIAKYRNNSFAHVYAIFKFFENHDINVLWDERFFVFCNADGCAYNDNVLQYYGKDWKEIYDGINAYDEKARKAFLYSFRTNKRSLGGKVFKYLRGKGLYNYDVYKEYRLLFSFFSHKSKFVLFLIAILPRSLFRNN